MAFRVNSRRILKQPLLVLLLCGIYFAPILALAEWSVDSETWYGPTTKGEVQQQIDSLPTVAPSAHDQFSTAATIGVLPEPSSIVLATLAAISLLSRARRRRVP